MIIYIYVKSCFVEYRKLLLLFLKEVFIFLTPPLPSPSKKTGFSDSILIKIAFQMLYMCTYLLYLKKKKKITNLFAGLSQISAEVESLEAPLPHPSFYS